jgi:sporulation protein YtfJ
MADSNLSKLVESALSNLKTMAEADTVIGKPLEVSGGTTVIPVSKITVGFTSGGIDYTSKNNPDKAPNFGGGTGTGYTITPIAFLVIDTNGNVRLLNVNESSGGGSDLIGTIAGLAEKAPSILEKTMKIFKKDKGGKKDKEGDSVVLNNEDLDEASAE